MLLSNKASSNLIKALTMHAWYVLKVFCIADDVVHQLFIHKHTWKSSMYEQSKSYYCLTLSLMDTFAPAVQSSLTTSLCPPPCTAYMRAVFLFCRKDGYAQMKI